MIPWQQYQPVQTDLSDQWKNIREAYRVGKGHERVTFPVFTVTGISWNDTSEVVYEFAFSDADMPFTIHTPVQAPPEPDMVLAVRFNDHDGSRKRYKFWSGIGEDLNYPVYNGEIIKPPVMFEVWNIETSAVASLSAAYTLGISILFNRTICKEFETENAANASVMGGNTPGAVSANPYIAVPIIFNPHA